MLDWISAHFSGKRDYTRISIKLMRTQYDTHPKSPCETDDSRFCRRVNRNAHVRIKADITSGIDNNTASTTLVSAHVTLCQKRSTNHTVLKKIK